MHLENDKTSCNKENNVHSRSTTINHVRKKTEIHKTTTLHWCHSSSCQPQEVPQQMVRLYMVKKPLSDRMAFFKVNYPC